MRTTTAIVLLLCACGPVAPPMECDSTVLAFVDADGDGFGEGPALEVCPGTPGYAANSLDCGPDDPRAFPGQSGWQNVPISGRVRNGLPWDFDCDGQVAVRWLPANQCYNSGGGCYEGIAGLPTPDGYWQVTPLVSGVPACGEVRAWIYRCSGAAFNCLNFSEARTQACL